jgi:seryl-tRNA(Sec) selenium transferase
MSTMGFNNKEQRKEKKENKAALKQSAAMLNKKPETIAVVAR